MYENITFESILQKMLNRIPNTFDKREGSIIYDALAPAALELQNLYIQLDVILNESFVDTQSREYLIKRCAERAIKVEEATYAIRQGEFNIDVPIGSRYSLNKLNYTVIEKISDGIFKLQCETAGKLGNLESGTLIPIDYVDGLQTALLTEVLVKGKDEEETEHLRQRYFDSLNSQAYGGNVADYKQKLKSLELKSAEGFSLGSIEGVKIHPVWNGKGTVKAVVMNEKYSKPSTEFINAAQEATDPTQNQGVGAGFAPIGHVVTVAGCGETTVNIQTEMTFQDGWDFASVESFITKAIDEYFTELSKTWDSLDENEGLTIRISQIETRLLDLTGISDIANTELNGVAENLTIEADNIPVRGAITNVR